MHTLFGASVSGEYVIPCEWRIEFFIHFKWTQPGIQWGGKLCWLHSFSRTFVLEYGCELFLFSTPFAVCYGWVRVAGYMRPNMYCIFIVSTERIKYDSEWQPDVSTVAELQLPSIVIFMCCALGPDRQTRERDRGKCEKCCCFRIYSIVSCEYVSALYNLTTLLCTFGMWMW